MNYRKPTVDNLCIAVLKLCLLIRRMNKKAKPREPFTLICSKTSTDEWSTGKESLTSEETITHTVQFDTKRTFRWTQPQ